jgi:hypothetical protein
MTAQAIRELLVQRPFQPFNVRLADGWYVRVDHHDWAIISPPGRTMVVYQKDGSFNIIDIMLVTDLELGPPAAPNPAP